MSKSIKVTFNKSNTSDIWPFIPGTLLVNADDSNHQILIALGVQIYYQATLNTILQSGNAGELVGAAKHLAWNNILEYNVHYYFPTDELFANYKNMNYSYESWWTALPSYNIFLSDNHVTITSEEISNPDLSGYVLSPEHEFPATFDNDI